MKPFTDWCRHKAWFFDSTGHPVGSKYLDWNDPTFVFKDRIFNFIPEYSSFTKDKRMFSTRKNYFYRIDNPMPILLDHTNQSIIDPKAYKQILETDLIKKINEVNKGGLLNFLMQPKTLIFILIAIGVIYYFSTGGTIT